MKCPNCQAELSGQASFCSSCGTKIELARPASHLLATDPPRASATTDTNKMSAIAGSSWLMVIVICAILSIATWHILGLIPRALGSVFQAEAIQQGCSRNFRAGTPGMFACSSLVAIVRLAGPLLILLVLFLMRKTISSWVRKLTPKLPNIVQPYVAPILGTIFFIIPWAGSHFETFLRWGILPQILFPTVVGLFTWVTAMYSERLKSSLSSILDWRDKLGKMVRYAIVFLVPIIFGMTLGLITSNGGRDDIANPPFNEQITVVVALFAGYIMLIPREGTMTEALVKTGSKYK